MASRGPRLRLRPESVRLLRFGLLAIAVVTTLRSAVLLLAHHPVAVDLEILLRATERWLLGEPPYLASAFQVGAGPDLPYLYPPALLAVLAPQSGALARVSPRRSSPPSRSPRPTSWRTSSSDDREPPQAARRSSPLSRRR